MFFFTFLKHEKDGIFFNENMLGKLLGFSRMHETRYFCFFKGKLI
jgi:hypothetical protein